MKNKLLRTLALMLSFMAVVGNSLSAFAYDIPVDENGNSVEKIEYKSSDNERFNGKTNVYAELASIYKVTIPKVVVLSGESKDARYFVKVEGDIAGYEQINVIPDENFLLYSKNKDSQTATINQDKIVWQVADFDTDANGTITAKDITAGKWQGTFNFNVNLSKVAGALELPEHTQSEIVKENEIAATCTKDGSYDEVIYCLDCDEELSRITKTVPKLGHKPQALVIKNDSSSCVKAGSYDEIIYCNLCGNEISRIHKEVTALGHDFSKSSICSRCGKKYHDFDRTSMQWLGYTVNNNKLYKNGKETDTITIPSSYGNYAFDSIGSTALRGITNLKTVIIEEGITYIGFDAFGYSPSIEKVVLPEGLKTIYQGAFVNCSKLSSISIPSSVTKIGRWAFQGCNSLKRLPISGTSVWNGHLQAINGDSAYASYFNSHQRDISITFNDPENNVRLLTQSNGRGLEPYDFYRNNRTIEIY